MKAKPELRLAVPEIEIILDEPAWTDDVTDAPARARLAAEAALTGGGAAEGARLTVVLADDAAVRELNRRFRGQDKSTNVLAFPSGAPDAAFPEECTLGDVILAHDTCRREAAAQGKPLADHLAHLVVHGVLHLLGRDHQTDAEAERMEDEERAILARIGVPDPYRDERIATGPAARPAFHGARS
jgi:probable rRNA maturation factor